MCALPRAWLAGPGSAVAAKLAEAPIDDALFGPTTIRKDGRAVHDMFLIQVKMPAEGALGLLQGRRHHPGS